MSFRFRTLFSYGLLGAILIAESFTVLSNSKRSWYFGLVASIVLFGIWVLFVMEWDVAKARPGTKHIQKQIPDGVILAFVVGVLLLGMAKAPHRSNDVYAYGSYGRLVSNYHVSPYTVRPSKFPLDPIVRQMAPGWRNARSVYGPGFTALSTVGAWIAGTSALRLRLWFQFLSSLATLLSALFIRRMAPDRWWLFAVNPVVLITIAHEGHNDALLALGFLGFLAAVRRANESGLIPGGGANAIPEGDETSSESHSHAHRAIACFIFAAAIKITALLALPAVGAWLLMRWGWRRSLKLMLPWTLLSALMFFGIGGLRALATFKGLRLIRSESSLWNLPWVREHFDTPVGKPGPLATSISLVLVSVAALIVASIALLVRFNQTRRSGSGEKLLKSNGKDAKSPSTYFDAAFIATLLIAPIALFITLAPYVLPWYWAWLLGPAVLLGRKARLMLMVTALIASIAYGAGTRLPNFGARIITGSRVLLAVLGIAIAIASLGYLFQVLGTLVSNRGDGRA